MSISLDLYAVFARVAETGSFSRAARDLGLSKATVSKRIAELEGALGVPLVARTTRRATLTEAGQRILVRALRILEEAEGALEEASEARQTPRGRLRVTAPMSFGLKYLAPALSEFLAAYPDITLDLRLADGRTDLIGDGFDAAVRISSMEDSSLFGRRLAPVSPLLVAAPSYWQARGRPKRPEDLASHACFLYANSPSGMQWRFERGEERVVIRPGERLMYDSGDFIAPALRAGMGVAVQPDFLCWEELQSGALEAALVDWNIASLWLHILTPNGRSAPRKVRAFADFVSEQFGNGRAPWLGPCEQARRRAGAAA